MISPYKIEYDLNVQVQLPRIIEVHDYHEFNHIKYMIQNMLGIKNIEVDEVGFTNDGMYIGVIHTKTMEHQKLVTDLIKYYDNEQGEPCDE